MTTLYKIASNDSVQMWQITKLNPTQILIEWGQVGGAIQEQLENVTTNHSGRSLSEQVQSRIDSRINKQLDRGYCCSVEEARQSMGLNASKLYKPMLAQTYDAAKPYNLKSMWWQYKYNGHRCLITRAGDKVFAYSRNGKLIDTINHITEDLDIPEGFTLDGELYIHDTPLQTISSIVRRKQTANTKLTYIVYDAILNVSFGARLDYLNKLSLTPAIQIAPTFRDPQPEMLTNQGIKDEAWAHGLEGFILRSPSRAYEAGKRSSQLLKVKMRLDAEATVVQITPSADGWAILHCVWNNSMFKLTAPGTMAEKTRILENSHDYIGSKLTFEYAELTKDGTPFHPVAIRFREEE